MTLINKHIFIPSIKRGSPKKPEVKVNNHHQLSIPLTDTTYNYITIKKNPVFFSSSKDNEHIINLTQKLKEENAPEQIKKGLPELVKVLCETINTFQKQGKINFIEAKKSAEKLDELLKNDKIKSLNDYLLNKSSECLNRIENLPSEETLQGIMMQLEFSKSNKTKTPPEELEKAFNTFYCRKILNDKTVALLNHYKNITELEPYKNELDKISKYLDNKILLSGLSPEVKQLVQKARENLGVRFETYDSFELSQLIYNRLSYFKSIGRSTTDILNIIEFDEIHGMGVCTKFCARNLTDTSVIYCKENNLLDKNYIRLNPWDLIKMLAQKEEEKIRSLLTHEHGHLWHSESLGDDVYYNPLKQFKYTDLLSPEEQNLMKKYEKIVTEAIPGFEHFFKNLDTTIDSFKDVHSETRHIMNFNDKLTDEMVDQLIPVMDKLTAISKTIDELPDAYARKYAKSSPGELVACAVEWSDRTRYSEQFEELLKHFGAPDMLYQTTGK